MKSIAIQSFGDPSGLALIDRPAPTPTADEVLIAVEAAGVGGVDTLIRSGTLGSYGFAEGHIPGTEIAGQIIETGANVDPSWRGQLVWAATGTGGGYAEQVCVPESVIVPVPERLSAADAVTLGGSGAVAHFALQRAELGAGKTVLIRGAAGGIGVIAVQLAAQQHAGAIAVTTSSPERGEQLRTLGATHILDRNGQPTDADTDAPETYDVIVDIVAGAALPTFISRLSPNGHLIVVGLVAGPPPADFGTTMFAAFQRSLTVATFSTNTISPPERRAAISGLFKAADQAELRAVIHDRLALRDAADAHRMMDAGEVMGRIVLEPNPD